MALLINKELAEVSACSCHVISEPGQPQELMCFSPGMIGTLSKTQEQEFCTKGKIIISEDGIRERVHKFRKASEVCKIETTKYPKGERLIPRIECMHRELGKLGVKA